MRSIKRRSHPHKRGTSFIEKHKRKAEVALPNMQDSLGGNAKTVIIANVSPGVGCARETQSTLGFAQRAKQIVNKARVNEDTRGEAALLTRENERLRRELQLLSDTYQALRQVRLLD